MLDVNAIAKGWGVDEVFEYLKSLKLSKNLLSKNLNSLKISKQKNSKKI